MCQFICQLPRHFVLSILDTQTKLKPFIDLCLPNYENIAIWLNRWLFLQLRVHHNEAGTRSLKLTSVTIQGRKRTNL